MPRAEVMVFAGLMEGKLRENDHKGGWQHDTPSDLHRRLREEANELYALLLETRSAHGVPPLLDVDDAARIGREAADVANFAMMIADVCGALAASPTTGGAGERRGG